MAWIGPRIMSAGCHGWNQRPVAAAPGQNVARACVIRSVHARRSNQARSMHQSAAELTMTTTTLHGLKGQVLRLRGVVDRFGRFEYQGKVQHTVCVRNMELASSGEPLQPDHWWFRLRQPWTEAGVQPGDTILFTAKVSSCSKGSHEPTLPDGTSLRARERVLGFSSQVRDLVVVRRGPAQTLLLNALQEQLHRQILLRQQAEEDMQRLERHRDALLDEQRRLRRQLALWKTRCQILDPGLASEHWPRVARAARPCRGFQSAGRAPSRQGLRAEAVA